MRLLSSFLFFLPSFLLASGSVPPEEMYGMPGVYSLVDCDDDQLSVERLVVNYDLEEREIIIRDDLEGEARHFHNVYLRLEEINGDYQRENVDGTYFDERSKSEGEGVFREYGRECEGWSVFTRCTDWEPVFEVQFTPPTLKISKWRRFGTPKDVDCTFRKV